MEVSRHPFYVFDLDEHASLISFVWTEKSVAMTVDDYKDAIREYAGTWSIEPDTRWSTYENLDTASKTRTFLGLGGLTKSRRCTIRPA